MKRIDFSKMGIIDLRWVIDNGLVDEYNEWAERENRADAKLPVNQPTDYGRLSDKEQKLLGEWIQRTFLPAKRAYPHMTSYGWKHRFEESEKGFYVTNGQFKGAMLAAGFQPTKATANDMNWRFRVKLVRR